jgi:hypothetical protein
MPVHAEVFPRYFREKTSHQKSKRWDYKPGGGVVSPAAGDSPGDSAVAAEDSDVVSGDSDVEAGDSVVVAGLVVSVVVGGLVAAGVAAGSVVSVFCSHAASSAAPARIQMYFFILVIVRGILL